MGFAPRHGEVLGFDPELEPTAASGMAAADEITACVIEQMMNAKSLRFDSRSRRLNDMIVVAFEKI